MIYLASPYSSPDPLIRKTRFMLAQQCCHGLITQGLYPFSPIVHWHELAERYELPTDFSFWTRMNYDFLRRSEMLMVLRIPGWRESIGVTSERKVANALNIPVSFVNEFGGLVDENS